MPCDPVIGSGPCSTGRMSRPQHLEAKTHPLQNFKLGQKKLLVKLFVSHVRPTWQRVL